MKKIILIIASVSLLGFACSEKKDYKCTCKTSGLGVEAETSVIINDTKDNATKKCSEGNTSATVGTLTVKTDCTVQ